MTIGENYTRILIILIFFGGVYIFYKIAERAENDDAIGKILTALIIASVLLIAWISS